MKVNKKYISLKKFNSRKKIFMKKMYNDKKLKKDKLDLYIRADKFNYCYNYTWFGEPFLQTPEDVVAIQELIYKTKPEVILEIGLAWGGTFLLYDSLSKNLGIKKIIGVDTYIPSDLKIRLKKKIKNCSYKLIQGDSTSQNTIKKILSYAGNYKNILIHLDSDHTRDHVYKELNLYSKLLKKKNYIIVSDTIIEYIPKQIHRLRNWGKGNNPKNAIDLFIKENKGKFKVDEEINYKQILTNNPKGYLIKI